MSWHSVACEKESGFTQQRNVEVLETIITHSASAGL